MANLNFRRLFLEWDYRDVRSIVGGFVVVFVISSFRPFAGALLFLANRVVSVLVLISDHLVNFLYRSATRDPLSFALNQALTDLFIVPVIVTTFLMFKIFREKEDTAHGVKRVFDAEEASSERKSMKKAILLTYLSIIILTSFIVVNIVFPFSLEQKFHHRMLALSDVMSEDEKNATLAKWAVVEKKSDYDVIQKTLERLSKTRNRPFSSQ